MSLKRSARSVEMPRSFVDQPKRGRGCRGKLRYPKRKQALSAMNGHVANHPDDPRPLSAYRCEECRGWHIGHDGRAAA